MNIIIINIGVDKFKTERISLKKPNSTVDLS